MVVQTAAYVYGIYICLAASKYLYKMSTYTYEGEQVAPEYVSHSFNTCRSVGLEVSLFALSPRVKSQACEVTCRVLKDTLAPVVQ